MKASEVLNIISELKAWPFGEFCLHGELNATPFQLVNLTRDKENDAQIIQLLTEWRKKHEYWFAATFETTLDNTTRWYRNNLMDQPDRLLFLVRIHGKYIGHVGLFRFNFEDNSCDVDNIIRGVEGTPGIISESIRLMVAWAKFQFKINRFTIETTSINDSALNCFSRIGFVEERRTPMIKTVYDTEHQFVRWDPDPEITRNTYERYNVEMMLDENVLKTIADKYDHLNRNYTFLKSGMKNVKDTTNTVHQIQISD